ncbi:hypothetical protein K523DRAFT_358889 [Schizophyllum commune Tattone D]|nr:hypothetical protein K523DRAFT_358889 [Schizophyllum commune Tattone D]
MHFSAFASSRGMPRTEQRSVRSSAPREREAPSLLESVRRPPIVDSARSPSVVESVRLVSRERTTLLLLEDVRRPRSSKTYDAWFLESVQSLRSPRAYVALAPRRMPSSFLRSALPPPLDSVRRLSLSRERTKPSLLRTRSTRSSREALRSSKAYDAPVVDSVRRIRSRAYVALALSRKRTTPRSSTAYVAPSPRERTKPLGRRKRTPRSSRAYDALQLSTAYDASLVESVRGPRSSKRTCHSLARKRAEPCAPRGRTAPTFPRKCPTPSIFESVKRPGRRERTSPRSSSAYLAPGSLGSVRLPRSSRERTSSSLLSTAYDAPGSLPAHDALRSSTAYAALGPRERTKPLGRRKRTPRSSTAYEAPRSLDSVRHPRSSQRTTPSLPRQRTKPRSPRELTRPSLLDSVRATRSSKAHDTFVPRERTPPPSSRAYAFLDPRERTTPSILEGVRGPRSSRRSTTPSFFESVRRLVP